MSEIAYSVNRQMAAQSKPAEMTQAEYARHRRRSRQYISKLAKAGVLVMPGGKIDVRATDLVLDDKPIEDIVTPPPAASVQIAQMPTRPAPDSLPQAGGASFGQARTIEMVFRAKLRRLDSFVTMIGQKGHAWQILGV